MPVQFVKFVGRVAQGDFGNSWQHSRPALDLILERAPASLKLGLVGLGIALVVGTPLGALAAIKKGTWIDQAARFVAVLGQATPGFWLGIMLLLILGVRLELLPISGRGDWRHLVMPGIVIAMPTIPSIVRIFRSSLIGVLERDYVRTARAKGLGGLRVFRRHVTRNASIPVITVISFEVGAILSGSLIAEVIFAYPGRGPAGLCRHLGPRSGPGPGLCGGGERGRAHHQHAPRPDLRPGRSPGEGAMSPLVVARRALAAAARRSAADDSGEPPDPERSSGRRRRRRIAVVLAACLLGVMILSAVLAPFITWHDPLDTDVVERLHRPPGPTTAS